MFHLICICLLHRTGDILLYTSPILRSTMRWDLIFWNPGMKHIKWMIYSQYCDPITCNNFKTCVCIDILLVADHLSQKIWGGGSWIGHWLRWSVGLKPGGGQVSALHLLCFTFLKVVTAIKLILGSTLQASTWKASLTVDLFVKKTLAQNDIYMKFTYNTSQSSIQMKICYLCLWWFSILYLSGRE